MYEEERIIIQKIVQKEVEQYFMGWRATTVT